MSFPVWSCLCDSTTCHSYHKFPFQINNWSQSSYGYGCSSGSKELPKGPLDEAIRKKWYRPRPIPIVHWIVFNRILDYRQERNWKTVPVDQCQEFLKFPKVINTQTANTANHIRTDLNKKTGLEIWFFLNQTSFFSLSNYQPKSTLVFLNTTEFINNNFECQLLDEYTDLWSDLAGSDLLNGEHYDCIRFKVPYNYSQSGFNSSSYRGFILYSKVYRWNEQENDLELERHSVHDKRHPNWFFRSTIRFWFCSCRSGSRYFF